MRDRASVPNEGKPAAIDNLVIEYTSSLFQNLSDSPYAGRPSPAIEAAWSDLLAPMHIRVTEAELRRDNQDSVALPEGGGYLGWLGVFHELHCVVCCACLATRRMVDWPYTNIDSAREC